MRSIHRLLAVAVAALTFAGTAGAASAQTADDGTSTATSSTSSYGRDGGRDRDRDRVVVYGLTTGQRIVTFPLDRPAQLQRVVDVKGLSRGEKLIGIDRRPLDGQVYGLVRSRFGARLVTVDPGTGRTRRVATLVSAPTATSPNRTPVVLSGWEFGVDFNPAADAFRIVSDTGQNLRVIPSARTAPDGTALQPGDTFTDGMLNRNGQTVTGVTAAAYTNNDTDPATATTLYVIDADRDELSIQNPPNAGTLTNTVPLERRTGPRAGFDVRTTSDGDLAVASLSRRSDHPRTRIVVVDLATGDVDVQGTIRDVALRDIALAR